MDAVTLARIFDPFFTTKPSGTGLGLTTCKNIVEGAGGFIRARSTQGSGSTFELFFPRSAGTPRELTEDHGSTLPRGSERVLVVDARPFDQWHKGCSRSSATRS
jgi:hypothetical protein